MSPNRRAALATAEALGGLICWTVGSSLGWHLAVANGWALNTILLAGCLTLEVLGLTMFTAARCRHARFMGRIDGKLEGFKEAEASMREFLTERAVFVVGQMPKRPDKPPVEKAN